ncbi:hypothetical protein O4H49_04465 [Kiloniella laminariae]|uniref:DUF4376 domain-containing protein n=1 Tax=Kiloniella laminariae TaxID=454162 RepID=A0ABT4LFZ2_9PROT|nr:hypothetical protein [Kiloniella laminariae]MCZ4280018.1 hypothetical protein [Kiloniella laminariae]
MYVIEKAGKVMIGPSGWTPRLAAACGLTGNLSTPKDLPFDLGDGKSLRAVRFITATVGKYQMLVEDAGALLDGEWVITRSAMDIPLEQAKQLALSEIKNRRDAIADEGDFLWTLDDVTYRLQGKTSSLTQMERSRDLLREMVARGVPAEQARQPWRTADNAWTPALTADQISDMAFTKGQQSLACWKNYAVLEARIIANTTDNIAKLSVLNLFSGWPETGEG